MIDEKALAAVQDNYADKNGSYKDMSIRTIIEAYESAKQQSSIAPNTLEKLEKVKQALEGVIRVADRNTIEFDAAKEALTLINELEQDLRGKEHIKNALKDILAMRESWLVNSNPKELLICLESIYKITKENLALIEPPKEES